jgi:hypothetical protein
MKIKPGRIGAWVLLVLLMGGMLYGFLGMIMGAWLGATPNFPIERAQRDVEIWRTVTLFCLMAALASAVMLYRGAKKRRQK